MAVKPKILTRLRINEVSSVDRGAGEGVKIMLMKRDFDAKQRRDAARSGAAMPDGSFPIENASDLHNAMRAVGRAKDPAKAKAHIRSRAQALGLTSELSDAFKKDNTMSNRFTDMFAKVFGGGPSTNKETIEKALDGLTESVSSILADDNDADKAAALGETFKQFGDHLQETLTAGPAVVEKEESIMDLTVLKKALGLADTATEADVTAAIAKNLADQAALQKAFAKQQQDIAAQYTADEVSYLKANSLDEVNDEDTDGDAAKKTAKKAFRLASHTERASIMKTAEPEIPAFAKKLMEDNAALQKRLDSLLSSGELVTLQKAATDALLPATEAETIQKAYAGDRGAVDKLLGFVKQANAAAKAGGVFKEFGSSAGNGVDGTAYDELSTLAKNLVSKDPTLTFAKAFAKVYEDPANVEIVKRERGENRPAA
jgi:hypothetical protein